MHVLEAVRDDMSLCGLHTGFDGGPGVPTSQYVTQLGFRLHRLEARDCSDDVMLSMIGDVLAVGATPLIVIWDTARLSLLTDLDVEWQNEMDGDVSPAEYRMTLDDACQKAGAHRVRVWGGVISNLDGDSLAWLNAVRDAGGGWPANLHGITAHRYGDGTFENPHRGFSDRDAEVKWLKAAAARKPIQITEFGYPSSDMTEDEQSERIAQEWAFWQRHSLPAYLYQLNDGPGTFPIDHFGIRRVDGSFKPAAYTVPTTTQESDMLTNFSISRKRLIPVPGRAGYFTYQYPRGTDTVLSVQPDGSFQSRPAGTAGAWESFYLDEDRRRAIFDETAESFAYPLVD